MAQEEDGLLALQGLHSDLVAFAENRLPDIERLLVELDSRVEEFRALLDQQGKSEASKKKLGEGRRQQSMLREHGKMLTEKQEHLN